MSTLHLTLKKEAFDVMVTGEKKHEWRKPSKWIESRLLDKNGRWRNYDQVKFTNGYGNSKPYFICEFICSQPCNTIVDIDFRFSNGLVVTQQKGDYVIVLGDIIEKGNLN